MYLVYWIKISWRFSIFFVLNYHTLNIIISGCNHINRSVLYLIINWFRQRVTIILDIKFCTLISLHLSYLQSVTQVSTSVQEIKGHKDTKNCTPLSLTTCRVNVSSTPQSKDALKAIGKTCVVLSSPIYVTFFVISWLPVTKMTN